MLVANSFDLWQKDTFFSAAEEVQQSADIMESAFRTWLRAKKDGLMLLHLDELGRELQMSLGTAKWQLEEFERAVRLSYGNHGDEITITRHRQFVSVIEDQIYHVETALKESLDVEGKKPFCWVKLDDEECDDLAVFLSGNPRTLQGITTDHKKNNIEDYRNLGAEVNSTKIPSQGTSLEDASPSNEGIEQEESRSPGGEISYQADRNAGNCRTRSSPDRSTLEIVIDPAYIQHDSLIEDTPKEKGSKPFFWSHRDKRSPAEKGGVLSSPGLRMISWMNQHCGGGHRSQRQQHGLPVLPVNSIRFILALMLTIFLAVPFLLYST